MELTLTTHGIIAIIRGDHQKHILPLAEALYEGGIRVLEVTLNSPGALAMIRTLNDRFEGKMLIGAGTVLSVEQVGHAAESGARFIVSPDIYEPVIHATLSAGLQSLPGAYTPTEIRNAQRAGAVWVKWFPATMGGVDSLKQIRAPLHDVGLVPTGGIDKDNAQAYLRAGAVALGICSSLVPSSLEGTEDEWTLIRQRAAQLIEQVYEVMPHVFTI